ncbi:Sucrose-phosphatase 1, partial [Bienertia sinuspersici]
SLGHGTMDRLNCAARVMLVSDLDCTMVDHDDPDNNALFKFNALWEAYFRHDSLLVFSTGRSPTSYKKLWNEKPLLTPDITVMSVGTEIAYGDSLVPDVDWEQSLNQNWDRKIVTEETAKFPELVLQSWTQQRPHKVSFFVEKSKASQVIEVLQRRLVERGLDIKIVFSGGVALDVLPRAAGKGQALTYLLKKFGDKSPINTLVCGDSGNDAELFSVPRVYGVVELMNPGFEVVNMYLACEKWQRGEVEKSEEFIQHLKSKVTYVSFCCQHPSGVFVHASGVEKPLNECLDAMEQSYRHMQDCAFRVWVDRTSSAQIGSDAWLVKYDKWVSSGDSSSRLQFSELLVKPLKRLHILNYTISEVLASMQ